MMELKHVSPSHIDIAWRDGAHMLSEACKVSGGEVTIDQLKMMLSRGERFLFAATIEGKPVGWVVVGIEQLPNVRTLHVYSLYAPNHMHDEFFKQLAEIGRAHGCTEVRCAAKKSQARLYRMRLGFEPVYQIMKVAI